MKLLLRNGNKKTEIAGHTFIYFSHALCFVVIDRSGSVLVCNMYVCIYNNFHLKSFFVPQIGIHMVSILKIVTSKQKTVFRPSILISLRLYAIKKLFVKFYWQYIIKRK